MKQFDLEEYLKNPNRKVVTRDGRDVRIICTDKKVRGNDFCVVGLVFHDALSEDIFSFRKNGKYCIGDDNCLDLFFAPEKHIGWINLYYLPIGCNTKNPATKRDIIHLSEHTAKEAAAGNPNYITTVKVEWEG